MLSWVGEEEVEYEDSSVLYHS